MEDGNTPLENGMNKLWEDRSHLKEEKIQEQCIPV